MIARLNIRLWIFDTMLHCVIWLLNHNVLICKPWNDPRKPEEDRITWLKAQPKSLRKAG